MKALLTLSRGKKKKRKNSDTIDKNDTWIAPPTQVTFVLTYPSLTLVDRVDIKMAAASPEHEKELEGWFYPTEENKKAAHISSMEQYKSMYKKSLEDPAGFWGDVAKEFYWQVPPKPENFLNYNFDLKKGGVDIKWMEGAKTNVCYNVLDRHVKNGLADSVVFYWWVLRLFSV